MSCFIGTNLPKNCQKMILNNNLKIKKIIQFNIFKYFYIVFHLLIVRLLLGLFDINIQIQKCCDVSKYKHPGLNPKQQLLYVNKTLMTTIVVELSSFSSSIRLPWIPQLLLTSPWRHSKRRSGEHFLW